MRTVRNFMDAILPRDTPHDKEQEFFGRPGHRDFWAKLCRLGVQKATKEPDECDDIDATAFLTDREWEELDAEFSGLH